MNQDKFCEGVKYLKRQASPFAKKVAPLYKLLNWTWGCLPRKDIHGALYYACDVPNEEEIKEHILRLINDLHYKKCTNISCGGLQVEINLHDQVYEYKLSFKVDQIKFTE